MCFLKKNKKFDDLERRLLVGIIQPPPRMKKRYDKMSREEMRKLKMGDQYSDEYDDEEPDSFEYATSGPASIDVLANAKTRNIDDLTDMNIEEEVEDDDPREEDLDLITV